MGYMVMNELPTLEQIRSDISGHVAQEFTTVHADAAHNLNTIRGKYWGTIYCENFPV